MVRNDTHYYPHAQYCDIDRITTTGHNRNGSGIVTDAETNTGTTATTEPNPITIISATTTTKITIIYRFIQ
jgi:hypothetical protein